MSTSQINIFGYPVDPLFPSWVSSAPWTRRTCQEAHGPPKALLSPLSLSNSASTRNLSNSPFLHKLPPEIRMLIYEYALGGNRIAFGNLHRPSCTDDCHPDRYHFSPYVAKWLLRNFQPEPSRSERVREVSMPGEGEDHWMAGADRVHQKLQLLLACRQIYNEAVLVPFGANEFGHDSESFESTSKLRPITPFPRDLTLDQSRAISTLHVWGAGHCGFAQQHINALSGLKRLVIGSNWNLLYLDGSPGLLMETIENRFSATGVSVFARTNLVTVKMKIFLTVSSRDMPAVMAQKDKLEDWLESKEIFLLKRTRPAASFRGSKTASVQAVRSSKRIRAQRERAKTSNEQ